jgi:hypothetical protein
MSTFIANSNKKTSQLDSSFVTPSSKNYRKQIKKTWIKKLPP